MAEHTPASWLEDFDLHRPLLFSMVNPESVIELVLDGSRSVETRLKRLAEIEVAEQTIARENFRTRGNHASGAHGSSEGAHCPLPETIALYFREIS